MKEKACLPFQKPGVIPQKQRLWVSILHCLGFLLFIMPLCFPTAATARTYRVDLQGNGDYTTIQEAIDVAEDRDTVVVADGTYKGAGNKNIDFKGKAITLKSENGPEKTIIDCEYKDRGFIFQSAETSNSILDGFSVINGHAVNTTPGGGSGGAILVKNDSRPNIINAIFRNNLAETNGGAIAIQVPSLSPPSNLDPNPPLAITQVAPF